MKKIIEQIKNKLESINKWNENILFKRLILKSNINKNLEKEGELKSQNNNDKTGHNNHIKILEENFKRIMHNMMNL